MFDLDTITDNIGFNIKAIECISDTLVSFEDDSALESRYSETLDKAIESEFNSQEELKAKKLMSAALLIAKKMELLKSATDMRKWPPDIRDPANDHICPISPCFLMTTKISRQIFPLPHDAA